MAANFDNSAWFYDRLARLVYGRAIINAQVYLLKFVAPGSAILIAGGGTGWILEELTGIHASGLIITYVDVSANMMALARKRRTGGNKVVFINSEVENAPLEGEFDVVFTPFLFDNIVPKTLDKIFGHIDPLLKPGGLWLNASFQLTGKWWQAALLKTMFIFFRVLCGIEASKLPPIDECFRQNNYRLEDEKTFFGDFIASKAYRR